MISSLRGVLNSVDADGALLDVHGVGLYVLCARRTLSALPPPGTEVTLATEMLIQEETVRLLGFATSAERSWFRLLRRVQGVGVKLALAILDALSTEELARAIAKEQTTTLTIAQGVGTRVARRLISELKDRVADISVGPAPGPHSDAVSALVNLGYPEGHAAAAVMTATRSLSEKATLPEIIRTALREMTPKP